MRARLNAPGPIFAGAIIAIIGLGCLDWSIRSELSISILYLLPVGVAAWFAGRTAGLAAAGLAATTWFLAEHFGRAQGPGAGEALWQSGSRLGFYVVTALLVDRVRTLTLDLEALVRERTTELQAEVIRRKQVEREAAEIAEREQERVARELHDGLAAYLAGVAFRIKTVAENLHRRRVPEAAEAQNLVSLVNRASDQVRSLARLLTPGEARDGTFSVALSQMGAEVEAIYGITCTVDVPKDLPQLTNDQAGQLYRVAQEAVRNAVQHSRGDLVQVSVTGDSDRIKLSIHSDGKSWDPARALTPGLGIRIMRYRTERLGGTLSIESRPAGGTAVICDVPLRRASDEELESGAGV